MPAEHHLKVVLCWHMHQPQYRDMAGGEYLQPWAYLHAMKDYVDMAALLEENPAARAVVNFSPVLLEQIDDYADQLRAYLDSGRPISDPLLAGLADPENISDREKRISIISACLRANEKHLINPYPCYHRIAELARLVLEKPELSDYLEVQFLADLLVWYHLVWIAETVRRTNVRVKHLIGKGEGFTPGDRRELLGIIAGLLSGATGRYRVLAERGQVELAMNPYAHPILPLLLDMSCAKDAVPDMEMPELSEYPEGEQRARWHLEAGRDVLRDHFGVEPKGCWPSEGGISTRTLRLLEEYGFTWAASGENVLRNSLARLDREAEIDTHHALYQPYRLNNGRLACFFRDDGLSDLIGFTYADWHGDDAAADFVKHLENIDLKCRERGNCVVSVILDGENAWEYYPNNGYHFLSALYRLLSCHPRLELSTFSDCLKGRDSVEELPDVVAGSWVYGTFTTWIGDPDKNRAWDYLGDAHRAYDTAITSGRLNDATKEAATRQLGICEGSDWFWWFGDENPEETVSDFEQLYRRHLLNLYRLIGMEPPAYLSQVMARGAGTPVLGGVMRHGSPG